MQCTKCNREQSVNSNGDYFCECCDIYPQWELTTDLNSVNLEYDDCSPNDVFVRLYCKNNGRGDVIVELDLCYEGHAKAWIPIEQIKLFLIALNNIIGNEDNG